MATNDIPTIIEPNSVIAPALTLNQLFEKHRRHYWERTSDVYPFSILTIGAIYKITGTKHYFGNTGIINVVKVGEGDYNRIRVWAPNGLFYDLDRLCTLDIVHIRPTGLHTDINTKKQYYTYELSISDFINTNYDTVY